MAQNLYINVSMEWFWDAKKCWNTGTVLVRVILLLFDEFVCKLEVSFSGFF
jgi:hypothetical protein